MSDFLNEQKNNYQKAKEFIKDVFLNRDSKKDAESDSAIDVLFNLEERKDSKLSGSLSIVTYICAFLAIFLIWAALFKIDEVSKGDGKIVPSSKEQIIQSLDGGILTGMFVKEGQTVEAGQIIAQLDTTRSGSSAEESEAKYRANLAAMARLNSEVNDVPLKFSEELKDFPDLVRSETRLYNSRKESFNATLETIRASRDLVSNELEINTRLAEKGAASKVDVIRLKRQLVDLNMRENELKANYLVKAREELAKVSSDVKALAPVVQGRKDLISKSTIKSPVRGIVKNIQVNTIGGVIPQNGTLMQIVPLEDSLLVETRISPRDIAFIHPQQKAKVKITAYDYTIYGSLDGEVTTISPDTIKDEQKPDVVYYRVYIRTKKDYIENKKQERFYITPGMVATVDIKTGSKTVLQYLIKPFNKINEALRER